MAAPTDVEAGLPPLAPIVNERAPPRQLYTSQPTIWDDLGISTACVNPFTRLARYVRSQRGSVPGEVRVLFEVMVVLLEVVACLIYLSSMVEQFSTEHIDMTNGNLEDDELEEYVTRKNATIFFYTLTFAIYSFFNVSALYATTMEDIMKLPLWLAIHFAATVSVAMKTVSLLSQVDKGSYKRVNTGLYSTAFLVAVVVFIVGLVYIKLMHSLLAEARAALADAVARSPSRRARSRRRRELRAREAAREARRAGGGGGGGGRERNSRRNRQQPPPPPPLPAPRAADLQAA